MDSQDSVYDESIPMPWQGTISDTLLKKYRGQTHEASRTSAVPIDVTKMTMKQRQQHGKNRLGMIRTDVDKSWKSTQKAAITAEHQNGSKLYDITPFHRVDG